MRIGVVVQRYGLEVNGGAELLCRTHAEHLAGRREVSALTVFTTCARDHQTWANHYEPGTSVLEGVRVERFPVVHERFEFLQNKLGPWVRQRIGGVHVGKLFDPIWFVAQGPFAPGLLRRLWQVRESYDVFVFYTYLYFPTVFGLPLVAKKAVLAPTAHDEEPIRMGYFRRLFRMPRAFAFLTPEEQSFMVQTFGITQPMDVVGTGITPIEPNGSARLAGAGPYIVYVGRVEPSKGFPAFFACFDAFKARYAETTFTARDGSRYLGKDLKLVLVGRVAWVDLPERSDVVSMGFVSDHDKATLVRDSELLVLPSAYESLSIVLLEAWSQGRAVLVNAACAATSGQVARSGGGGSYRDAADFAEQLAKLLEDPRALEQLAERGRAYTRAEYVWPAVEDRMLRLLQTASAGSL